MYRWPDPFREEGWMGWVLVVHTTVMFSFATVATAMALNLQSISHIDNRGFLAGGALPPGPLGYQLLLSPKAISLVPNLTLQLNQWLADGLMVTFVPNSLSQSNLGLCSSSIAATLFIL